MRTKLITYLLPLTVLAACGDGGKTTETTTTTDTTTTVAEAPKAETPKMDSAAMAKAWMDYMTPGDMHKWMASQNGTWSGEVKSWESPDAPPATSTAAVTNKMIMGGRYQESAYKGMMMGQPFEGISMLAYDNAKKKFVNTWIDNMGTGIMIMEGTMDEGSKTLTLEGEMDDVATGKTQKMRQVLKYPDATTQTMEMYCEKDGKDMKMMEVTLKRK